MPRPNTSINPAYKANIVQTLTGLAANTAGNFTLSAAGANPGWFYLATNRALPAQFVISNAWCSAQNAVVVRLANVTGTSAALGSCNFEVVAI